MVDDKEIRKLRAAAYEHRLEIERKKRRWKENHSCQFCHRLPAKHDGLCQECYKHEWHAINGRLPSWAIEESRVLVRCACGQKDLPRIGNKYAFVRIKKELHGYRKCINRSIGIILGVRFGG